MSNPRPALLAILAALPALATAQEAAPQPDYQTFADSLLIEFAGEPAVRFHKTTPGLGYTWQITGDELGLFFEDMADPTNHRRLTIGGPLAGSNPTTLFLSGEGAVLSNAPPFMGASPAALLHVYSLDAGTFLPRARIEEGSTTVASRNMLRIVNRGASTFRFDNSTNGSSYGFGSLGSGDFFIGSTPGQPLAFRMTPSGDVTITGALSQGSDRNSKHEVVPVDADALLARVAALPLSQWSYLGSDVRHVGPMAQDFAAAFHLGSDDTHLAPADLAGVGLAALQALDHKLEREVSEQDLQILELKRRLAALEARLGPF